MANTSCGVNIPTISSAFISKDGHEILSDIKASRYIEYINILFGRVFAREYINNSSYVTLSDFSDDSGKKLSLNGNLIKLYNLVQKELDNQINSEFADLLPEETKEKLIEIYQNWELFIDYHSMYNDFVFIDDIESSEEEQQKTLYDRRGNEYIEFELISNQVQTLFKFLPKAEFVTDIDGSIKIEEAINPLDGLPIPGDYENIIKLTLNALKGIKDDNKFIETLTSPELLKRIPELEFLFRILPIRDGGVNTLLDKQRHLLNLIYISFSRDYIPVTAATRKITEKAGELPSHYRYNGAKGTTVKILDKFIYNFSSNLSQTEYSKTDNTEDINNEERGGFGRKILYNLPQKLDRIEISSDDLENLSINQIQDKYSKYFDFLKIIGIEFSDLSLLNSISDKEDLIKILNSVLTIHDNLSTRLSIGDNLYSPLNDIMDYKSYLDNSGNIKNIQSLKDIVNNIAEFESRFSKMAPTVVSIGASGEKQSDISYSNSLSIAAEQISSSRSLDELVTKSYFTKLRNNPMHKYSWVINNIIGTTNKYTIENYSGYTIKSEEDEEAFDTKSLSNVNKFVSDFSNLLGWGRINTPQLESKSGYFSLNFLSKDSKGILPFGITNFENGFIDNNTPFTNQILGYLRGEVERVKQYREIKNSRYNIPTQYGELHIFKDMVSEDQLNRLMNTEWDSNSPIVQEIIPNIEKYFEDQFILANEFINSNDIHDLITSSVLRNTGISSDAYADSREYYKNQLLRTFLANDFIHNVEFGILISGDPLFFKDWHKRLGGLASTGIQPSNTQNLRLLFSGDSETLFWNNYSQRGILNQYSDSPVERRDNFDTFYSAVLSEDIVKESTAYQSKEMVKDFMESYYLKTGETITPTEAEKALKIRKIGEDGISVGDGQGYLNMDAHRELSIKQGTYKPQHDVSYKYQALIFKRYIIKKDLSKDEENLLIELESQINRDPEKYALPTLKQSYYGTINNSSVLIDAKVYDKFSLFPLLPSIAKGNPKLEKLLLAMANRQIYYVKYKSGTKGYVKNQVKNLDELFDSNFELDELKSDLLKLQILPSKIEKTETGLATQTTKLLYTNLFGGKNETSSRIIEQRNKFIESLNNIQSSNKKYVLNKLGFITDENHRIISWDKNKIIRNLVTQINIQKLPLSLLDAFELDEDGEFKNIIESSGIYQQLMNYIVGKLDSGLRQFKLNGGDFILISESMFKEPLKYFRLNKDKTKIEPLECRITLTKEFSKLLNLPDPKRADKVIGSIDRLNELLEDKNFIEKNRKALTVTFSRPPVQGPNSMGVAIIKEFFSPTVGNILQLPKEFMHQAGIDFDYDKEKVYIPSLSYEGIYISDEDIQERLSQLESEYVEFREIFDKLDDLANDSDEYSDIEDVKFHLLGRDSFTKLFDSIFGKQEGSDTKYVLDSLDMIYDKAVEYLSLKFKERALNNNKLLQSTIDSILLPELFSELVIPNNDSTVKSLARKNGEDINNLNTLPIGNSVYTYMENLKVFKMFNDAKRLLGPFALNNVFSQLIAPLDIHINLSYLPNKNGNNTRHINLLLDNNDRGDRVNISLRENFSGENKQHLNSEFINATVDSNKDPYFANFMLSFDNINTFIFLFNIGYPVETIVDFTSSAIVRKYLKNKETNPNLRPEELLIETFENVGISVSNKIKMTDILSFDASNRNYDKSLLIKNLKTLKKDSSLANADYQDFHKILLANFIAMEEHSKEFSNFKNLFKNDTNKTTSLYEIFSKELLRNNVIRSGMFSATDIMKIENKSTLTAFRNDDIFSSVIKEVFPLISNRDVVQTLGELFSDRKQSLKPNDQKVLSQILVNDFIGSILFTYGYYKDKNIFDYAKDLVRKIKKKDKEPNVLLLERLFILRNNKSYSEFSEMFPVLDKITADISKKRIKGNAVYDNRYAFNVKLDIDPNTTPSQKQNYINQFKLILNGNWEFKSESVKENLINFVKDLFIAGLIQTGFNKTNISFLEFMPVEFIQDLLNPAIDFYHFEMNNDVNNYSAFIEAFKREFKTNNSKYFYFSNKEKASINKNSHIGKNLRVIKYPETEYLSYHDRYSNNRSIDIGSLSPEDFTNHSGGAEGSDKQWDDIGNEYGFINHNHYYIGAKDKNNAPYGNSEIVEGSVEYNQGALEAAKAARVTYGYTYKKMKDVRLIRNWSQVKNADAIFAIGQIANIGEKLFPNQKDDTRVALSIAVMGGTGYAVQMAINHNKPVYVYDQVRKQWYKNINGEWSKSIIPVLTPNYAGIGTRNINSDGIQAIRDVYEKTLLNISKNISASQQGNNQPKVENALNSVSKYNPEMSDKELMDIFLDEEDIYFVDPTNYTEDELDEIFHDKNKLKKVGQKVTASNIDNVLKLDDKFVEIVYNKKGNIVDILNDFNVWKEDREADYYSDFYSSLDEDILYYLERKYLPNTKYNYITKDMLKKIYFDEEFKNEEDRQKFVDFLNSKRLVIEFTYNPNQLSLFDLSDEEKENLKNQGLEPGNCI